MLGLEGAVALADGVVRPELLPRLPSLVALYVDALAHVVPALVNAVVKLAAPFERRQVQVAETGCEKSFFNLIKFEKN